MIPFVFLLSAAKASEPTNSEQELRAELASSIATYYQSAYSCREVGGISVDEYISARHTVLERLTQLIGLRSALLIVEEWEAPESYGTDLTPEGRQQFEAFMEQFYEALDELRDQMNAEVGPWIRQRCIARLLDGDYKSALLAEKLSLITEQP